MRMITDTIRLRRMLALVASLGLLLAASSVLAGPEHIAGIEQECVQQLGYAPERCDCVGDRAESDLDDNQQAFMYAHATKNTEEAQRLQGIMTIDEMTAAGEFMTGVANICQ